MTLRFGMFMKLKLQAHRTMSKTPPPQKIWVFSMSLEDDSSAVICSHRDRSVEMEMKSAVSGQARPHWTSSGMLVEVREYQYVENLEC